MGLGTGYVIVQNLGIFRVHKNLYSTSDIDKKRGLFGEINITTGYWIGINFPAFKEISIKLVSRGYANYLNSHYMKNKKSDADCKKMVADYLSKLDFLARFKAYFMIFYYFFKLSFQDFALKKH